MTTRVGIRELKARLSHYLERAANGETVVVTVHGKARAELRPLSVEARIQQGIEEGWIRPGRPGPLAGKPRPTKGAKGRMTIAEAMAEDRDE